MDPHQVTQKGANVVIRLRRNETSIPWGFRMQGGIDYALPLFIQKVNPRSIAGKSGLMVGDGIIRINNTPTTNMQHSQAKMEIIRAGNEIDFLVQRGMMEVQKPPPPNPQPHYAEEPSFQGHQNPRHQSRSFKMLEQTLQDSAAEGPEAVPDSIFTGEQRPSGQ